MRKAQARVRSVSYTHLDVYKRQVVGDPRPFVLETSLSDWYPVYQINAYIKQADKMAQIYSDLHQNIQDKFNEAGIEIMSPHYMACLLYTSIL